MINSIKQWINKTNIDFNKEKKSCSCFIDDFNGFYPISFLNKAYFVVVEDIPKPDFPGLREMGLGNFIDMKVNGITYKNTYYILPNVEKDLKLHFHELVHVAQWSSLGTEHFIERYIKEIQKYGYIEAPLEKMAYGLEAHYADIGNKFDIPIYVSEKI